MKIMVLGDLHGDIRAGLDAIDAADQLGITHIIQTGDFGYWPHYRDGIEFLDVLNSLLMALNIQMYWLDGNHENFDQIERDVKYGLNDGHGRVFIRNNIRYCSRGAAWTWDHKRFMTVGGAVSVDKEQRIQREQSFRPPRPRTQYWPQETLTRAELELAKNRAKAKTVDYLFTHDCPTNAPFQGRMKNDLDSAAHRQLMDELGKSVKPTLWFHGHMHTRYDGYQFPTYESTTTVYGMECNPDAMVDPYSGRTTSTGAYWGVLDTETDQFTYADQLTDQ